VPPNMRLMLAALLFKEGVMFVGIQPAPRSSGASR